MPKFYKYILLRYIGDISFFKSQYYTLKKKTKLFYHYSPFVVKCSALKLACQFTNVYYLNLTVNFNEITHAFSDKCCRLIRIRTIVIGSLNTRLVRDLNYSDNVRKVKWNCKYVTSNLESMKAWIARVKTIMLCYREIMVSESSAKYYLYR